MTTAHSPHSPPAAARAHLTRETLRVLLLDDDDFQLELVAGILQGLGVKHISSCTTGQDALRTVETAPRPFDLMVSDLHMPGMDGFEFMGAVAQKGFHGSLILISGQSQEVLHSASLVAQLRRFNFLGAIPKPVSRTDLSRLLSTLC